MFIAVGPFGSSGRIYNPNIDISELQGIPEQRHFPCTEHVGKPQTLCTFCQILKHNENLVAAGMTWLLA
jgi:hypothetical protein